MAPSTQNRGVLRISRDFADYTTGVRADTLGGDLPVLVSRELRAISKIKELPLSTVVEKTRALMSELVERPGIAVINKKVEHGNKLVGYGHLEGTNSSGEIGIVVNQYHE
ncbi:hypothetical protein SK128_010315 [Halocaridina rubra]|uniref:Uncharacterized protein n=1 Tax=Halocaridina rubra TaxID=373956 RepID=A0AAN8WJU6_HALRR